ncbi:MAG: hypothetical protein IJJ33_04280 [Victivallales bacterium]|nr:hypothetical protein [Victivallales bacterium]
MKTTYLGIDLGTTGIKAALFLADGTLLGEGLSEYTLETPRPDIVELVPERYLEALGQAIQAALQKANRPASEIRGMGITGQAETLIVTDADGAPLRKAIVWLDNRAVDEAREIESRFGIQRLFALSGQTDMLPCWPAAKIAWLRRHEPTVYASAAKYLMVEDFVAWKLTGVAGTCRGLLPSTIYYDLTTGEYASEMLDCLGLKASQLPELRHPGEPIGYTRGGFCGLPDGIPVAAAPLDHICGCIGSGGRAGVATETTGCSLAVCAPLPKLLYDDQRRISTYHGFLPDSFVLLPWAPTAGMLLKHFRDEFCSGQDYDALGKAAAEVPPGADGLILLPHCAGAVSPDCNPAARDVAWGVTLAHKRGHWARAIMESVAFLLRDNLEALRTLGANFGELRALGGGARSRLWLQIKADVLRRPIVTTACPEATALGAAILGAVAAGDFTVATEAADTMVKPALRIEPGPDAERYEAAFQQYRQLNQLLLPTFK